MVLLFLPGRTGQSMLSCVSTVLLNKINEDFYLFSTKRLITCRVVQRLTQTVVCGVTNSIEVGRQHSFPLLPPKEHDESVMESVEAWKGGRLSSEECMNIISHLCETRRSVSEIIPLQFMFSISCGHKDLPLKSAVSLNAKFKFQELMKTRLLLSFCKLLRNPLAWRCRSAARASCHIRVLRIATYDVSLRPQIVRLSTRPPRLHLNDEQMLYEPRHHRDELCSATKRGEIKTRFGNTRRCSVSFSQHAFIDIRGVRKHLFRCRNAW